MIEDKSLKFMQRVVGSEVFHTAEVGRFDTVMVQIEKNISVQGTTESFSSVWLGKSLALLFYADKEAQGSSLSSIEKGNWNGSLQYVYLCLGQW